MPSYFTGINGAVINNLDTASGSMYNLRYYIRNGCGSLLNSNADRKCNCKVVVEYSNYADEKKDYHVDDEYCPSQVLQDSKVIFTPSHSPLNVSLAVHVIDNTMAGPCAHCDETARP
jgi:hypothetical protein